MKEPLAGPFTILLRIAYQSAHNVNQQMSRVLFRQTAYGIMVNLLLDIAWLLVDGRLFPAARLFTQSLDGRKAMVARTGGDEFLMLAFFPDDAGAEAFIAELKGRFADYNREKNLPVPLAVSVGYCACAPEQTLQACMEQADAMLYAEKQRIHAGR